MSGFKPVRSLLSGVGSVLFGKMPSAPDQAAPPPPVIEDAAARRQDEADRLRARRGRASAILTGQGGAAAPQTASKVLLGQ